ncbi:MAG: NUDIX domain-containing protein [Planctomycetota bacterium]|jgi:putative (di)nucleoside polyphosphate hydrolase
MAKPHFRAGVVAAVRRADGRVMAFERSDLTGEWQLPQGGIESGESPKAAAWRELAEETGLGKDDVRLVEEIDDWTVYAWPTSMRDSDRIGQAHRWFFFEPLDDAIEPTPDGKEFCGWRWIQPDELIELVVDFRKAPYRKVFGV